MRLTTHSPSPLRRPRGRGEETKRPVATQETSSLLLHVRQSPVGLLASVLGEPGKRAVSLQCRNGPILLPQLQLTVYDGLGDRVVVGSETVGLLVVRERFFTVAAQVLLA